MIIVALFQTLYFAIAKCAASLSGEGRRGGDTACQDALMFRVT